MLPSSRLFRSRWAALFWAGGILWAAADIARSAPHGGVQRPPAQVPTTPADDADLNAADVAVLSNTLGL